VGGELPNFAEFEGFLRFDTIPACATFSSFSFMWSSLYFDLQGRVGFVPSLWNPRWSSAKTKSGLFSERNRSQARCRLQFVTV